VSFPYPGVSEPSGLTRDQKIALLGIAARYAQARGMDIETALQNVVKLLKDNVAWGE
jgi:hypothetical protein